MNAMVFETARSSYGLSVDEHGDIAVSRRPLDPTRDLAVQKGWLTHGDAEGWTAARVLAARVNDDHIEVTFVTTAGHRIETFTADPRVLSLAVVEVFDSPLDMREAAVQVKQAIDAAA